MRTVLSTMTVPYVQRSIVARDTYQTAAVVGTATIVRYNDGSYKLSVKKTTPFWAYLHTRPGASRTVMRGLPHGGEEPTSFVTCVSRVQLSVENFHTYSNPATYDSGIAVTVDATPHVIMQLVIDTGDNWVETDMLAIADYSGAMNGKYRSDITRQVDDTDDIEVDVCVGIVELAGATGPAKDHVGKTFLVRDSTGMLFGTYKYQAVLTKYDEDDT